MILLVPLHKKKSVGDGIGELGLVVDKIAHSVQERDLRLILHNHQIDYHLHALHRKETLGSAGDEMGQVLNERGREQVQLLKILRNRHFVPHHDLPLMILGFRRILHFLLHRKKEREQKPVSLLTVAGDEQEVVNRPSPAVGQERK